MSRPWLASARWLRVAHALDDVTTDTQGQRSEAATGASDLALWTGRLAYSDPQWTLTSGPRYEARPSRSLVPEPGDIPLAVAAVHHACDAMTRLAMAGLVVLDVDLEVVQEAPAVFGDAGKVDAGAVGAAGSAGGLAVHGHGP